MSNGVPTTLLPIRPMLDDLLGNHEDSTVRVPFETFVGLVTAALRAPIRKKWLFAADLQPNGPTQVASARQVLDDWALRHSDAAAIYLLGDLVHEASEGGTGAAPAYGIPELLEDWALRGLPEMKPLSGNGHDRDGSYQLSSGGTRHEKAWTYRTYREHLGEQHYLIVDGNMAVVMLGDMAGSTFGEITRPALEWFRDTLMELQGKNVIIGTHEPVEGAWNPTGSPAKTAFHRYSAELVAIASQHDNICAWFYGHVGFDYALSTEIREFAGTLHIGVQMGLERGGRIENGGEFDWPFHYAVIEAQTGVSGLSFRREDAKTGAVIPGTQMTIPTKYPVHFHAGSSFDGRFAAQRTRPILRGPVTITMDASDRRVLGSGGQYYAPSGETPMLILAPTEIAVDDLTTGHGWSVDFYIAGSVSKYLSTADGVTEVPTGPSEGDLELTFASLSEFPAVGDPDTWYLAQNTGLSYRWVSGAYTLVQAGRYVTAEPGLGWGGRIVPVKASAADNNFSADMLFYASGSGETDASKVLFGIGRSTGVFEAPAGLTVAGPLTLPAGSVTRAALANGTALSLIGRASNSTGAVADIAAGSDHQVLRRSGSTLGFGAIALNQSAAVTGALPLANGGTGATDAAGARTNLGLGTAAPATLTTSDTDVTAGRVPTVGWLGLGMQNVERGLLYQALGFAELTDANFQAGIRYLLLGRYENNDFKMSGRFVGGRAVSSTVHGNHAVIEIHSHKGAGGARATSTLMRHTSDVTTRRVQVKKVTYGGEAWLAIELFGSSTVPAFRSGITFIGFANGLEPQWVNASTISGVTDPDYDNCFFELNNTEVFRRANVLGTVSQTGGVPTGAVIESGSNSNGRYFRFADGTQICYGSVSITPVANTPTSAAVTFAAAFASAAAADLSIIVSPHTSVPGSQVTGFSFANPTTTGFDAFVFRNNTTATVTRYVAIGRWF